MRGRLSQAGFGDDGTQYLNDWKTGETIQIEPSGEVWSPSRGYIGFVEQPGEKKSWIQFYDGENDFTW